MSGSVVDHQGGIKRIGRVARVLIVFDHRQGIVFHFAVFSFAEQSQSALAAETEPRERVARNDTVLSGNGGNVDRKRVEPFEKRLTGEDLFTRVVPIAVLVVIDPSVEEPVAAGGRDDQLDHRAHQQRREEVYAVVEGVAAGVCILHRIGLMADSLTEMITASDHMPSPVVVEHRGIGGIGCVAEVQTGQRDKELGRTGRLIGHQGVVGQIPNRIDLVAVGRGIIQLDRVEAAGSPDTFGRSEVDNVVGCVVIEEVVHAVYQWLIVS